MTRGYFLAPREADGGHTDLTVSEFLLDSTRSLTAAGIETPRLEAELLLSHALGVTRQKLILEPGAPLPAEGLANAKALVEKRTQRIPLQYLTGTVEFLGAEFRVRPGVFIPRPETEVLVTEAQRLLAALAAPLVLEIGTGSGVIAVSLATAQKDARIHATDISPLAIETALDNARRQNAADRIQFHPGDLFSAADLRPLAGKVDLVVSNPPYVPSSEIPSLSPEVSRYECLEAIDGGADGLKFIEPIIEGSAEFLRRGGWLVLEMGIGQASAVMGMADSANFSPVRVLRDVCGIERVLVARAARAG